jgi:fructose 1,6-bisphosphatase
MNQQLPEIKFDTNSLVKEEVFTDQKIGSIRILTPMTLEGTIDNSRSISFFGQTQVMTPGGALPLNFELKAETLGGAIEMFGDAAKESMEQTMREIQEYQREQASKIVVPGQNPSSKIQMP